jgi:beta-glucosidase
MLLPGSGGFHALNEVNRLLAPLGFSFAPFDDVETNRFGWPIIPEGLADGLASLHRRYGSALPPLPRDRTGAAALDLLAALDPAADAVSSASARPLRV